MLITLGIIGIVAAMTMPTLIQKQQEKETIVKLKKAYSALSQAYLSASSAYGNSSEWDLGGWYSAEGAQSIGEKMLPYLKTSKVCGVERGCFPNVVYQMYKGGGWYEIYNTNRVYKMILADGTLIGFESAGNENCANPDMYCAKVFVDVNGFKSPNQAGYDTFSFYLQKGRVMPYGYQGDPYVPFPDKLTGTGECTTAWVIVNENMDYKRCPEKLGWDKASSCK